MAANNDKINIGYYIPKRKLEKMNFQNINEHLSRHPNVTLTYIDIDTPLDAQGPFDLIFHKVTDELSNGKTEEIQKVQKLEDYLKAHRDSVIDIDPAENQRKLMDRTVINELLTQIEAKLDRRHQFKMPKHIVIDKAQEVYDTTQITFPVICKSAQACGTVNSHTMGLVFNEKGLHEFTPPFIVQEFYNHNSTIYKVFVVDDYFSIVKRLSLPNLPEGGDKTLWFDSQKPLGPQFKELKRREGKTDEELMQEASLPPSETIGEISKAIGKTLGLTMFGFDVITQIETGNHAVVDINYFPTYGGVTEFFDVFTKFLIRKVTEKKNAKTN